jgi:hypothetical protein
MKKSQIQQIKEGLAMRQKTYSGRLQPFGPHPKLPEDASPQSATSPPSAEKPRSQT